MEPVGLLQMSSGASTAHRWAKPHFELARKVSFFLLTLVTILIAAIKRFSVLGLLWHSLSTAC